MKKKFILICCFLFINLQVSANNFDEIEIENQKCIENTFPYNYPNCAIQNEKNWDIEINNQLKKLEKIMKKEDYNIVMQSQEDWKKFITTNKKMINKFISNRPGIVNQTIGYATIADLKRQRAKLLDLIYYNYKDELELKKYE